MIDHHIFVIAGDGCLQEGISHEAASLAGHLGLGQLVAIYDDNHITIDGDTALSSTDDVVGRFLAYHWHVEDIGEEANDLDALEAAVRGAMAVEDRPSLIVLRSHIGYPSPEFTDSPKAHGDPFPPEEIVRTKEILGLPPDGLVLRARRRGRRLPAAHRRAGAGGAGRVAGPLRRPLRRSSRRPGGVGRVLGPDRPRRVGQGPPPLPAGREDRHPPGRAEGDQRHRRQVARHRERRRRPHRQHRHEARRRRDPVGRAPRRPPAPLRHPRARHGRRDERHGRPRRHHPRGRHVLLLQRLRAPRHPPRRPQHREGRSSSSPTTRSVSARTAPPTSRSSSSPPCGPCPSCS